DVTQDLGVEGRAGRVERRIEAQQARVRQALEYGLAGREELGLVATIDHALGRADHVTVVIVVPAWDRVGDGLAGIDDGPVGRVDARSRAAGDQDRIARVAQAELALIKVANRLAQLGDPVARRIVGLAGR